MKNNCNVARDLMPLVIDGVASEESRQYVDEHIAECTECAVTYGSMKVELPRANQEKERAEMEKAAKKLRKKRILRAVIAGLLAIAVFLGGVVVWKEAEYRLTQTYSKTMALDEYSVRLVQTKAGNVIICTQPTGRENLAVTVVKDWDWAGIQSQTKSVMDISMMTTVIPQYLTGDDANTRKMLNVLFSGVVKNGEWYSSQGENASSWDEVALISGDERQVIYTKGDEIPYCSDEMEAYYAAYHEPKPAGKSYPEWRVDLVKLLDATPEMRAKSDDEYRELLYVCENGYLSIDALYYDVCQSAGAKESPVRVDLFSFPSGDLPFNKVIQSVPVNDDTAVCVQYHIMYAPDDPDAITGSFCWTGFEDNGEWVMRADGLRDEDGTAVYLPIIRYELHAGDAVVVLWEEGDELQSAQEATQKREAEEAKYKK